MENIIEVTSTCTCHRSHLWQRSKTIKNQSQREGGQCSVKLCIGILFAIHYFTWCNHYFNYPLQFIIYHYIVSFLLSCTARPRLYWLKAGTAQDSCISARGPQSPRLVVRKSRHVLCLSCRHYTRFPEITICRLLMDVIRALAHGYIATQTEQVSAPVVTEQNQQFRAEGSACCAHWGPHTGSGKLRKTNHSSAFWII